MAQKTTDLQDNAGQPASDGERQPHVYTGVCNATHNMTLGTPDDTLQYLWCVEGEWKLLVRHHGKDTTRYQVLHGWDKSPVHLYHLKEDPHEQNDLATAHPDIVADLRRKIEAWHPVSRKRR